MFVHARISAPNRFAKCFDGKLERFVTKSGKSGCQTRVRQTIVCVAQYTVLRCTAKFNVTLNNS